MVDVVVVGAGPTGLMLAGELALAGVDVVIVERRSTADLVGSRAGGFHARTIEILDQRGIAERFLAGWVDELAAPIHRGVEVTGFAQDDDGVDVQVAGSADVRARYLVGADGGRSVVRRAAGIEFPGWEATTSALIAEVQVTGELPVGVTYDPSGIHGLSFMEDGRTARVVSSEPRLGLTSEPTLTDLRANLTAVYGTDFGVHDPTWISRFTDATRRAAAYRSGRVLLAGDAAHIHSPTGGQGIGLGVQDAVNLGWKLAQVVKGISSDDLLDTYQSERHPADARALAYSKAMSALQRQDARIASVRDLLGTLLTMDEPRHYVVGMVWGLDVRYDLGDGHPLLGRRMPDLDLVVDGDPLRLYSLLHTARPVLIDRGRGRGAVGGSGASHRRLVRRHLGAAGDRGGHPAVRGAGPSRRVRGLGR